MKVLGKLWFATPTYWTNWGHSPACPSFREERAITTRGLSAAAQQSVVARLITTQIQTGGVGLHKTKDWQRLNGVDQIIGVDSLRKPQTYANS
jgi:hypothetical protein